MSTHEIGKWLTSGFKYYMWWSVLHSKVQDSKALFVQGRQEATMLKNKKQKQINIKSNQKRFKMKNLTSFMDLMYITQYIIKQFINTELCFFKML